MISGFGYSFEFHNALKVQARADRLSSVSSDVLEARIEFYIAQQKTKPFHENERLLALSDNHPAFEARGAVVALTRRHGEDYVGRILNERKPKGFWETVKTYLTGKIPQVEEGHQFLLFS
ncbi:MAG: hypothetical protein AABX53_03195 [Nanoarchaeota archaeon]